MVVELNGLVTHSEGGPGGPIRRLVTSGGDGAIKVTVGSVILFIFLGAVGVMVLVAAYYEMKKCLKARKKKSFVASVFADPFVSHFDESFDATPREIQPPTSPDNQNLPSPV